MLMRWATTSPVSEPSPRMSTRSLAVMLPRTLPSTTISRAEMLAATTPLRPTVTHTAGQRQQQGSRFVVGVTHHRARPLQIFLQFERVALDREIQITNGESGNDVADRAPGQIEIHPRRLGGV